MMDVKEYKAKIRQLLIDTDYTVLPDVALDNKDSFIEYRAVLRECYKNPDVHLDVFTPPNPEWTEAK
jgi:hypothetical protein